MGETAHINEYLKDIFLSIIYFRLFWQKMGAFIGYDEQAAKIVAQAA